jgi:hypothetical protein
VRGWDRCGRGQRRRDSLDDGGPAAGRGICIAEVCWAEGRAGVARGGLVKGEQSSVVGSSLPSGSLSGRCFGADNAR